MKIINTANGEVLAENIQWANTFGTRLKGLMFKKSLNAGEGIVLYPCSGIHTYFMKFDIDVLFLDKERKVLKQMQALEPGKALAPIKGAKYVVETPGGYLKDFGDLTGCSLHFDER